MSTSGTTIAWFDAKGVGQRVEHGLGTVRRHGCSLTINWPCGSQATLPIDRVEKLLETIKQKGNFVLIDRDDAHYFIGQRRGKVYMCEDVYDAELINSEEAAQRLAFADARGLRAAVKAVCR